MSAAEGRRPKGRPPRTTGERERRRHELVAAAIGAVRHHGPDVSLEQIAEYARVSKPVLYSEFGDKNGLVDEIAVALAGEVEASVRSSLAAGAALDAEAVIGAVIAGVIDLIDDEPQLYAYIVRSIRGRDGGLLDNAFGRVVHERASQVITALGGALPGAEVDVLADGVFGFVFGVVEGWVARRVPAKDELIATMTGVLRAGVADAARRAGSAPA